MSLSRYSQEKSLEVPVSVIVFFFVNILDTVSTYLALSLPGTREGGLIMSLLDVQSSLEIILFKAGFTIAFALFLTGFGLYRIMNIVSICILIIAVYNFSLLGVF